MNIPKLVKYTSKDCRCPCGGPAAISGTARVRLPLGLGFAPNSSRFQIDALEYKGWQGECMTCGKDIVFYKSKRHVTTFPKSINRKLALAR